MRSPAQATALERPSPLPLETPFAPSPALPGETYSFSPELISFAQREVRFSAAIEALTTEVMTRVLDAGRRGLAISGASRRVGVTFTAANLAISLSQAGINTLLIDANMRDPRLQRLIMPSSAPIGLSDLLRSEDLDPVDVIRADVLPNLSLIYAGEVATDAADLVCGDRFKVLLQNCQRDHVLTIVDTPAANLWADARAICKLLSYAMVVARRNVSFAADLATWTGELHTDGVQIVAAVMNEA